MTKHLIAFNLKMRKARRNEFTNNRLRIEKPNSIDHNYHFARLKLFKLNISNRNEVEKMKTNWIHTNVKENWRKLLCRLKPNRNELTRFNTKQNSDFGFVNCQTSHENFCQHCDNNFEVNFDQVFLSFGKAKAKFPPSETQSVGIDKPNSVLKRHTKLLIDLYKKVKMVESDPWKVNEINQIATTNVNDSEKNRIETPSNSFEDNFQPETVDKLPDSEEYLKILGEFFFW